MRQKNKRMIKKELQQKKENKTISVYENFKEEKKYEEKEDLFQQQVQSYLDLMDTESEQHFMKRFRKKICSLKNDYENLKSYDAATADVVSAQLKLCSTQNECNGVLAGAAFRGYIEALDILESHNPDWNHEISVFLEHRGTMENNNAAIERASAQAASDHDFITAVNWMRKIKKPTPTQQSRLLLFSLLAKAQSELAAPDSIVERKVPIFHLNDITRKLLDIIQLFYKKRQLGYALGKKFYSNIQKRASVIDRIENRYFIACFLESNIFSKLFILLYFFIVGFSFSHANEILDTFGLTGIANMLLFPFIAIVPGIFCYLLYRFPLFSPICYSLRRGIHKLRKIYKHRLSWMSRQPEAAEQKQLEKQLDSQMDQAGIPNTYRNEYDIIRLFYGAGLHNITTIEDTINSLESRHHTTKQHSQEFVPTWLTCLGEGKENYLDQAKRYYKDDSKTYNSALALALLFQDIGKNIAFIEPLNFFIQSSDTMACSIVNSWKLRFATLQANQNDADAIYNLFLIYRSQNDLDTALYWGEKAIRMEQPEMLYEAALEYGNTNLFRLTELKAEEYARKAFNMGITDAKVVLDLIETDRNYKQRQARAIREYKETQRREIIEQQMREYKDSLDKIEREVNLFLNGDYLTQFDRAFADCISQKDYLDYSLQRDNLEQRHRTKLEQEYKE